MVFPAISLSVLPHTVCCTYVCIVLLQAASYVDMGYLVLSGIDSNEPLDPSQEEYDWLRLSTSDVVVLCVKLSAVAQVRTYYKICAFY